MGDVYLTYDESGKAYFRRWVYLNILLLIMWGIIFVVTNVDVIFIILSGVLVAALSFVYALYFVRKTPPIEPT